MGNWVGRSFGPAQLVRTTIPDDFGQPIPTFVHTHPDDFAHAETYMWLVANRWGRWHGWAPGG